MTKKKAELWLTLIERPLRHIQEKAIDKRGYVPISKIF